MRPFLSLLVLAVAHASNKDEWVLPKAKRKHRLNIYICVYAYDRCFETVKIFALRMSIYFLREKKGLTTKIKIRKPVPSRGGAKDAECDAATRAVLGNCDAGARGTLLLETNPAASAVPAKYNFLDDYKDGTHRCTLDRNFNQGDCNSCWAFSYTRMLQYRLCKK
jgi:hypothetical protein